MAAERPIFSAVKNNLIKNPVNFVREKPMVAVASAASIAFLGTLIEAITQSDEKGIVYASVATPVALLCGVIFNDMYNKCKKIRDDALKYRNDDDEWLKNFLGNQLKRGNDYKLRMRR